MAQALKGYLDKKVSVLTCDGKSIVGILKGFDQVTNLILNECVERIFSAADGVKEEALGLQMIRGDNVAVIGEFDEAAYLKLDLKLSNVEMIKPVTH